VDQRTLRDIMDLQPEPASAVRRRGSWLRQNWLAVLMFITWAVGQAASGGAWAKSRESSETSMAGELRQLREELQRDELTFVRNDVFREVLQRIEQKIDNLAAARRSGGT
jgi:hypothetical protein